MPRCLAGVLDREARAEERRAVGPICDVVPEAVQGLCVSVVLAYQRAISGPGEGGRGPLQARWKARDSLTIL